MVGDALSICSIYIIPSFSAKAENLRPKGAIGRYRAPITAKRRPISSPRPILPEVLCLRREGQNYIDGTNGYDFTYPLIAHTFTVEKKMKRGSVVRDL